MIRRGYAPLLLLMRLLVSILLQISKLAVTFPKLIIVIFVVLGAVGFATMSGLKRDRYPRMSVSFRSLSRLFINHPKLIVVWSVILIVLGSLFALKITQGKDLFRVFLARNMDSMAFPRGFRENFSQTSLSLHCFHLIRTIGDTGRFL